MDCCILGAGCSWIVAVPFEFPDGPHLRIQIRVGVAHGYDYCGMPKQLFHRNDLEESVLRNRQIFRKPNSVPFNNRIEIVGSDIMELLNEAARPANFD